MGFAGRLEGIAPSDIFQIISQSRMTGTLIARCQEGTAMVVFQNGQVIEAASDAPQESLGSLLISQGLVGAGTLEAAEQRMKRAPDQPLGAVLVDMGAISAKALEGVVLKQIEHIVHRLVSCEDGFITFDRGETAVKRKINTREFLFPTGVSTEYLMMEGARIIDEERRHVADRRAHPRGPLPAAGPAHEAPSRAAEQGRAGADVHALIAWFSGIKLPKMDGLRNAAGSVAGRGKAVAGAAFRKGKELSATAVQKGKQIAGSAGDLFHRTAVPWFESVLGRIHAFSPDGRALIYAGAVGIAAGIALILLTTLTSRPPAGELVITGRVVNIRATPATRAKVVAKVERGETVSLLAFAEGWYQVRTKAGASGWIWEKLAERKEKKGTAVSYGMTGSGFVLVAGVALLVVGITRRRRIEVTPPRILREVK